MPDVAADEIVSIRLTTLEGQVISITGKDGTLSIDPPLMDGRIVAEDQLGRITGLLETLDFTDVRALPETDAVSGDVLLQADLTDTTSLTLAKVSAPNDDNAPAWVNIGVAGGSDRAQALR